MKSSILKELQRIELAIRGIDPLADIAELEAAQSDMQALIVALQAADTSLQAQISGNDTDISGHASLISALQAADSSLQSQISGNDTDISGHASLISALQAADSSLQSQISGNDTDISGHASLISALQAADSSLQSQISGNDTDISGHNSRISALEASGVGGGLSVAIVQDQKTSGTSGGTFTAGAWRTRDLNTIVSDPDSIIVSLTSNQFVLASGDYLIMAMLPSHFVGYNQGRILDETNNAIIATSAASYGRVTYGGVDYCHLFCQFSSTGQSIAIQHACSLTRAGSGFGLSSALLPSPGVDVYTQLLILKIG